VAARDSSSRDPVVNRTHRTANPPAPSTRQEPPVVAGRNAAERLHATRTAEDAAWVPWNRVPLTRNATDLVNMISLTGTSAAPQTPISGYEPYVGISATSWSWPQHCCIPPRRGAKILAPGDNPGFRRYPNSAPVGAERRESTNRDRGGYGPHLL
jgi:hypothetical protein